MRMKLGTLIGLNGDPSIILLGYDTGFSLTPQHENATWNIKEILSHYTYNRSFIIGAGYAVKPYMLYNGQIVMNATYSASLNITNASRIVYAEASNGQRKIEILTDPDKMKCSFMCNFFVSENQQDPVIRMRAKGSQMQ